MKDDYIIPIIECHDITFYGSFNTLNYYLDFVYPVRNNCGFLVVELCNIINSLLFSQFKLL